MLNNSCVLLDPKYKRIQKKISFNNFCEKIKNLQEFLYIMFIFISFFFSIIIEIYITSLFFSKTI